MEGFPKPDSKREHSVEQPTGIKESKNNERPYWLSENGLENPLINGVLKESITEEQALEVQREWKDKAHQWEERSRVHYDASAALFRDTGGRYDKESEFREVEAEAKKIADDYYKTEYVPAYHRYFDLWTVPGRIENANASQDKSGSAADLRESLDRFKRSSNV